MSKTYILTNELLQVREENRQLRQELYERVLEHEKCCKDQAFAEKFLWAAITKLTKTDRQEILALMRFSKK